ncbi:hypothetical protein [Methylobacterium nodulans]|uniref:Uncharacterized protein n=1 Tax=Methylobacterium nodulans (strain LMG 21967 / CNCM I-2342 / ORS 2060) TaxID=460265 RepID=B8INW0_METNO|nr:hypothetical protein [Methylobacterium nodulans]ACL58476.1 hypothetical protein Mnod_3567 [Methylobacterium nodulans ORS 2060]
MKTRDHRAVMASRREPPDSLEFFPTPPWSTRALCELLRAREIPLYALHAWEPACGQGHMVGPLGEYFQHVEASDIFDYGRGFRVHDFLQEGESALRPAFVVTNPPFSKSPLGKGHFIVIDARSRVIEAKSIAAAEM